MARYSRRIKYVRKLPKKKWAPFYNAYIDVRGVAGNMVEVKANSLVCWGKIIDNSGAAATPTPTVIKAGNFKVTADASYAVAPSYTVSSTCYIVFVPEGWVQSDYSQEVFAGKMGQLPTMHPEWIIAQGCLQAETAAAGSGGQALLNTPAKSFSSRLKRNLQSGDAIYYLWIVNGMYTNGTTTSGLGTCCFHTNVRAYTCNN